MTAPLADPGIGLVTCLYRAEAHDWPSRFEALAIATDFAPSTLVARMFGVSEFGLGSTLAFRSIGSGTDRRISGHRRLYRRRLSAGPQNARAGPAQHNFRSGGEHAALIGIVAGRLAASGALGENHSIVRRRADTAGLPITYASLWVVIAALFGLWWIALPLLAVRLAMAMVCGWFLLGSADVWKYCYAIPLRDLCGVAVWAAGLFGHTVVWRDQRLRLDARRKDRLEARTCYNGHRAPVAQLDRASGYEPEGRMFESCRAHHKNHYSSIIYAGFGPLCFLMSSSRYA